MDKNDKNNPGTAIWNVEGNSIQDMLLTAIGWKFGQHVVAAFLRTNLKLVTALGARGLKSILTMGIYDDLINL